MRVLLPSVLLPSIAVAISVGCASSANGRPVAGAPDETTVAVTLPDETLHLRIRTQADDQSAASPRPDAVRCTMRLERTDGSLAGPAEGTWPGPRVEEPTGEWSGYVPLGEETGLLFWRASDGMYWLVHVRPERVGGGRIGWTVTDAGMM